MKKALLLIVFLLPIIVFAQVDHGDHHDSENQNFILNAFNQADNYMNSDHYDSAQFWLNKIYLKVSYRKPSLLSYFLTSRQAEVYYYNNLHQLGLQEAFKGENIAYVLKDSLLIADACNFIGLFYMNNNKLKDAIRYFKKGLIFAKQPPYDPKYIELSKPHHIYGNLAEAYEKLNQNDSAVYYSRASLKNAKEINSSRGVATASLNLGSAFIHLRQLDSARKYFELTHIAAVASHDFDVELNSYSGLANCASLKQNKILAFNQLDKGFSLMKKYPQLNDFYSLMFLETAVEIYKKFGNQAFLVKTLQLKNQIQKATYERNNTQIQTLLLTGLKNEKLIFNLELAESQNKQSLANTRLYIILLVLLLIIIGFIAYRYYALQNLKLANLRNKISQDLHDEVGATLSGIAMYSYITKTQLQQRDTEGVNRSLDVIKDNAGEMVGKLNDIVWVVNPVQDSFLAITLRLQDFSKQFAATKNIHVAFNTDETINEIKIGMEQRKNIYLICKEAINNAIKYSNCSVLKIDIKNVKNNSIAIAIKDNGIGFYMQNERKGNGLLNMKSRADEINARLEINSEIDKGTTVNLLCHITQWGIGFKSS